MKKLEKQSIPNVMMVKVNFHHIWYNLLFYFLNQHDWPNE